MPIRYMSPAEQSTSYLHFRGPSQEQYLNSYTLTDIQVGNQGIIRVNPRPPVLSEKRSRTQLTPREITALALTSLGASHDQIYTRLDEWFEEPSELTLEEWQSTHADPLYTLHQKLGAKNSRASIILGRRDEIVINNAFAAGIMTGTRPPEGIWELPPASWAAFVRIGTWLGTRLEGQKLLEKLNVGTFAEMRTVIDDAFAATNLPSVEHPRVLAITLSKLTVQCLEDAKKPVQSLPYLPLK